MSGKIPENTNFYEIVISNSSLIRSQFAAACIFFWPDRQSEAE